MTFARVQARYVGRLGVEVGIFVAVDHLRRAGRLSAADEATYLGIDAWFDVELPNPGFYADGNSVGAVTWFREPLVPAMAERIATLVDVLARHGIEHDTVHSEDPGEIVYEDPWQVGVVPRERRAPSPAPEGVTLSPTTGGSKLHLATPQARRLLDGEPHPPGSH